MSEPRWHVIASTGAANFVGEQLVAEKLAKEWDYQFPKSAPHRAARLVDATELEQANLMIEQQAKLIERLEAVIAILSQKNPNGDRNPSPGDPCGRSCEGTAYRIELRQAMEKIEQQAQRIAELERLNLTFAQNEQHVESLRKALTEIAEWTDRYTSPGHPVSTVAKRALTGK